MSIIAFNFTKINAERTGKREKYQLQSKTAINDIKPVDIGKQKTLVFTFKQETVYAPSLGKVSMEGEVVVLSSDEEAKETLEMFKKNKRFSPKLMEKVYNIILERTGIESLIIARDVGLPPPIRLPRIAPPEATPQKAAAAAPVAAKPAKDAKPKKK